MKNVISPLLLSLVALSLCAAPVRAVWPPSPSIHDVPVQPRPADQKISESRMAQLEEQLRDVIERLKKIEQTLNDLKAGKNS